MTDDLGRRRAEAMAYYAYGADKPTPAPPRSPDRISREVVDRMVATAGSMSPEQQHAVAHALLLAMDALDEADENVDALASQLERVTASQSEGV